MSTPLPAEPVVESCFVPLPASVSALAGAVALGRDLAVKFCAAEVHLAAMRRIATLHTGTPTCRAPTCVERRAKLDAYARGEATP